MQTRKRSLRWKGLQRLAVKLQHHFDSAEWWCVMMCHDLSMFIVFVLVFKICKMQQKMDWPLRPLGHLQTSALDLMTSERLFICVVWNYDNYVGKYVFIMSPTNQNCGSNVFGQPQFCCTFIRSWGSEKNAMKYPHGQNMGCGNGLWSSIS